MQVKAIPEFDGYYCDQSGNVYSDKSGEMRQMKTRTGRLGYVNIALKVAAGYKYPLVHRLVLQTFRGLAGDLHCNHKNGIRSDNRLENLEWVTRAENERHARKVLGKLLHGQHHPCSKVTPEQVNAMRQERNQGMTLKSLAEKYGLGISQVSRITKGEKWAHIGISTTQP